MDESAIFFCGNASFPPNTFEMLDFLNLFASLLAEALLTCKLGICLLVSFLFLIPKEKKNPNAFYPSLDVNGLEYFVEYSCEYSTSATMLDLH